MSLSLLLDNHPALPLIISSPNPLHAKLKRPLHPIRQPKPDALNLLPQNLRLRLDDEPVIRPDEHVPLDQDRLPLPGLLDEQPVLVKVGGDHGFRLDVYKVRPAVGSDPERQVDVGINVPEGFAEHGWRSVDGSKGRVARPFDFWSVGREGGRDAAVESGVGGRGGRGRGYEGEGGGRGAAYLLVGKDFAVLD